MPALLAIFILADVPTHDLMNAAAWEQVAEREHDDTGIVQIDRGICTDAGGAIPQWLQRTTTRRTLPDTVGDLVREAKRRQADRGGKSADESP